MTFGHCATLLTQMHFFFCPNTCALKEVGISILLAVMMASGLAHDLVLSKRMTLTTAALMDHRQPSALLTRTARAINTRNGSKLNTTIMGWNTC